MEDKQNPKSITAAAQTMSKLGARKGGYARAVALSKEERSAIARKAVLTRWQRAGLTPEQLPKATHSGILKLGKNFEIPCHVLENGDRILSTRGIMKSLGRTWRGRKYSGTQYPVFLEANNLKPYISEDLDKVLNPIHFLPKVGYASEGFNAEILPIVCETYLKARDAGVLTQQQSNKARNSELLIRGFSRVGIIALIDEATGFQAHRTAEALREILEKFIAKELRPWVKTFQDDYYKEIFRLHDWPFNEDKIKRRPGVIGKWTNDIVYDRLAPGVREELHRLAERDEKGKPKHKLFQRLTEGVGHPKLREHLSAVIALMKAAENWKNFRKMLQRALPAYNTNLELPFQKQERQDL